uniref:Eukaryotic translation initiation factor 3 subunit K n=2 Tax=Hemiselmis andersenii TaxID=464988 RepID=A0A7S0Y1Q2_HEMAN|mmetsp:Transcript_37753/g.87896  ORF Transcript_37753/g.87896 Transcript_37753/m.87896 type:complete len:210 (+) Transcript_37753:45-674(+)
MSTSIADQLVERRFDMTFVPVLEAYVEEQIKTGTSDLDANLALLRFYQYSPSIAKVDVARKILTKALMALPQSDFMLCMYIVPPSVQADPSIVQLKSLADKLESCFFDKFWAEMASAKIEVPGFEDAVRGFIAGVIAATFTLITPEELGSHLNASGGDLDKLVAKYGWEKTAEGVKIPRNDKNNATVGVKQEAVSFEHVAPIVVASGLQ